MEKLILDGVTKELKEDFSIRNISFGVREGEIKIILGASGSGKTTILNIIAGILSPDKGSVIINGRDVTNFRIEDRKLGFVFQDLGLFYSMNVTENIAYGLRLKKFRTDDINRKVLEISEKLSLSQHLRKFPSQLSGGEKQLVALARTLVTEPDIILMDEPLSSLDTFLRNNMRWLIRDLRRKFNITVVYVTHDMDDAAILGDSISILDGGQIVQDGPKSEVFQKPHNEKAARILGYNIITIRGEKYALHPDKVLLEGPTRFKLLQVETGIVFNFLVETEYGRIFMRSDKQINPDSGISIENAIKLEGDGKE